MKQWIGIDLGGTKIAAALISKSGRVKGLRRESTRIQGGWPELKAQLVSLCKELQEEHGKAVSVGIGSAGPLHAPSGRLLDPTNFGWTSPLSVNISRELSRSLKLPVELENDAAAAVLAECWKGGGGKNCVALTLGTGLGVGVVSNGKLLRGGRGLHPEGGHIFLRAGDHSAPCGCGNFGCAEAFLSGTNFARRASRFLNGDEISGAALAQMARGGDSKVIELFAEYAELLAEYLHNIVVLYYPEQVILTGSFAEAAPLFIGAASKRLKGLLSRRLRTIPLLPELRVSQLGPKSGVIGAAFVAINSRRGVSRYASH